MSAPRLLVAGVGNIFLGDDAFGCEVAQRLAARPQPDGVRVVDFGIRGLDLAYTLLDGYDGAVLIDAAQRGRPPGTLYLLEVDPETTASAAALPGIATHGMEPAKVLVLVREMGGRCPWLRVVACEPATFGSEEDPIMGLSAPVLAAVDGAVEMVEGLVREFLAGRISNPSLGAGRIGNPSCE
jgi:hydrogenase maturation protease